MSNNFQNWTQQPFKQFQCVKFNLISKKILTLLDSNILNHTWKLTQWWFEKQKSINCMSLLVIYIKAIWICSNKQCESWCLIELRDFLNFWKWNGHQDCINMIYIIIIIIKTYKSKGFFKVSKKIEVAGLVENDLWLKIFLSRPPPFLPRFPGSFTSHPVRIFSTGVSGGLC